MPLAARVLLLALLPGSLASGQGSGRDAALASLVAAERAFARTSVEHGVREAFLRNFAPKGIGFQPLPVEVKAALLEQPAPTGPPPVAVSWEPEYADVSRAGDLGYTTGPAVLTDLTPARKPPRHGTYFTIWKQQEDGSWKVVLDAGTDGPEGSPGREAVLALARPPDWKLAGAAVDRAASLASLLDAERALLAAVRERGLLATLSFLGEDARFHRWGHPPFVGRASIRALASTETRRASFEPIAVDVSVSDDLGYGYGRYELAGARPDEREIGYYTRVFRRDAGGAWKVVLDTWSPVPQGRGEAAFVAAGYAFLERGQLDDAISTFERMIAAHPRSANGYDCLSDAQLARGDRAGALESARRALALLADDPNPDAAFKERVRQSAASKVKQLAGE